MPAAMSPAVPTAQEALEIAGRIIDRQIQDDRCYPDLSELLAVPAPGEERSVARCLPPSSLRPPWCPRRTAAFFRVALAGCAWPATRGGPQRAASRARPLPLGGYRLGQASGTAAAGAAFSGGATGLSLTASQAWRKWGGEEGAGRVWCSGRFGA